MKQRIINWLLRKLLNAITLDEIVTSDKAGVVMIDGKPINPAEMKSLLAEAKAMSGFRLWSLMSNTTKHHAEEKIFNKSINMDDIRFGKAMLYNLSLQQSIINYVLSKKLS